YAGERHGVCCRVIPSGIEVVLLIDRLLLDERQNARMPRTADRRALRVDPLVLGRGKDQVDVVKVVDGERELANIVGALRSPGRLASCLDSRQQQRDQDANNGNDNEQLDQGKSFTRPSLSTHKMPF